MIITKRVYLSESGIASRKTRINHHIPWKALSATEVCAVQDFRRASAKRLSYDSPTQFLVRHPVTITVEPGQPALLEVVARLIARIHPAALPLYPACTDSQWRCGRQRSGRDTIPAGRLAVHHAAPPATPKAHDLVALSSFVVREPNACLKRRCLAWAIFDCSRPRMLVASMPPTPAARRISMWFSTTASSGWSRSRRSEVRSPASRKRRCPQPIWPCSKPMRTWWRAVEAGDLLVALEHLSAHVAGSLPPSERQHPRHDEGF